MLCRLRQLFASMQNLTGSAAIMLYGLQAKWRRLEQLHDRFAPFRDASIDRWHRKTLLSGGNAGAALTHS